MSCEYKKNYYKNDFFELADVVVVYLVLPQIKDRLTLLIMYLTSLVCKRMRLVALRHFETTVLAKLGTLRYKQIADTIYRGGASIV